MHGLKLKKRLAIRMVLDYKKPCPFNWGHIQAILSKLAKKRGKGAPTIPELAEALGLCERQIYRLKTRYREKGAQGLAHGNRGRKSPRRIPREMRDKIVKLAT